MKKKIKFVISNKKSLGKDFMGVIWTVAFMALLLLHPNSVIIRYYVPWAVVFFHLSIIILLFFCGRIFYREYTNENVISIGALLWGIIYLGIYLMYMFFLDAIIGHFNFEGLTNLFQGFFNIS